MPVKRHFLFLFLVVALLSYGGVRVVLTMRHNPSENSAKQIRPPDIYFYDKSGSKVTLDDFKGKVVLVNLWATWCLPCVAEMPFLNHLQELLSGDSFQVVAISLDRSSLKAPEKFLQEKKLTQLDLYWDQDRQVPLKWAYEGLPISYLIDREGFLIAQYSGPYEWDKSPLLDELRARLR